MKFLDGIARSTIFRYQYFLQFFGSSWENFQQICLDPYFIIFLDESILKMIVDVRYASFECVRQIRDVAIVIQFKKPTKSSLSRIRVFILFHSGPIGLLFYFYCEFMSFLGLKCKYLQYDIFCLFILFPKSFTFRFCKM